MKKEIQFVKGLLRFVIERISHLKSLNVGFCKYREGVSLASDSRGGVEFRLFLTVAFALLCVKFGIIHLVRAKFSNKLTFLPPDLLLTFLTAHARVRIRG